LERLFEEVEMPKSVSYQEYLINSLQDPVEAAGYLNAALENGDMTVFFVALHNVVQAQGGVAELAEKTNKSRTSLYKALSKQGNPYLKSIHEILAVLGMSLTVLPSQSKSSIRQAKSADRK
jgi:probable addiction module antidote protein